MIQGLPFYQDLKDNPLTSYYEDGRHVIYGSHEKDDTLASFSPPDDQSGVVLVGGKGNDELSGTVFSDILLGGDDADSIVGAGGDDVIGAGAGEDVVIGGTGSSTIDGGDDADLLTYADLSVALNISLDNIPSLGTVLQIAKNEGGSEFDHALNFESYLGSEQELLPATR